MRRALPLLLLGGCEGVQSALDTHGPQVAETFSQRKARRSPSTAARSGVRSVSSPHSPC